MPDQEKSNARIIPVPHYNETLSGVTMVMPPHPSIFQAKLELLQLVPNLKKVSIISVPECLQFIEAEFSQLPFEYSVIPVETINAFWAYDLFMGTQQRQVTSNFLTNTMPELARMKLNGLRLEFIDAYFEAGNHGFANIGDQRHMLSGEYFITFPSVKSNHETLASVFDAKVLRVERKPILWLYHINFFIKPLADGVIGLINPECIDPDSKPGLSIQEHWEMMFRNVYNVSSEDYIHDTGALKTDEIKELGEGIAATLTQNETYNVTRYTPSERRETLQDVKMFLNAWKSVLESEGFKLELFKTNADMVLNFQASTASIITSPNHVIMPVYPDKSGNYDQEVNDFNESLYQKYNFQVTRYKDKVIPLQFAGIDCSFARVDISL